MDITFIATVAVSCVKALVPFFKKGGEKLVGMSAAAGFEKHTKIWHKVKDIFQGEYTSELNLFRDYPEDKDIQTEITYRLEERLKENHPLTRELAEDLKAIPEVAFSIERILLYLAELEKYKNVPEI